jgi:ATP-dependent RNA helicase DDX51/DBP6
LLKKEDVRHFKDMLRKADNNYVTDEALDSDILRSARTWVTDALDTMRTTTTTAHPANLKIHNQSKKDGVQKKRRKYSRFMPEIPQIPTLY